MTLIYRLLFYSQWQYSRQLRSRPQQDHPWH